MTWWGSPGKGHDERGLGFTKGCLQQQNSPYLRERTPLLSSRPLLWLTGGIRIATLRLFSSMSMRVSLWAALAGWPSSWTVPAGRSSAVQMAP